MSAPASAPIACASRRLTHVRPGAQVVLTVRLGDLATATLTGRAAKQFPEGLGSDGLFRRGATVVVTGPGGTSHYRIPKYADVERPEPELNVIGSRTTNGYLCIVRFTAGPVALVGVEPGFMGEAPELILLRPGGRTPLHTYGGFDALSVVTSLGPPVILTTDMRFFEVGQADSDSGAPLRAFTVVGDRLVNVSQDYPRHIEADAARWWHQFKHPGNGPYDGAIASWAADECTLDRQQTAFTTLHRLAAAGDFHGGPLRRPSGPGFVRYLERFLRRTGYAQ